MSSLTTSLDATAAERRARLAKLASLKRKRPDTGDEASASPGTVDAPVTDPYISGRNFDILARGPKLGFEQPPNVNEPTVEQEAARIARTAEEQAARDAAEIDKSIDLFKLQPKKPNWDLKRDLAERMKVVDARTQNAIARLVRDRIEKAKKEARSKNNHVDGGEELGVEGSTLVEAVHLREQEEQEESRRDRDLEDDHEVT